jgi:hypothetical protein
MKFTPSFSPAEAGVQSARLERLGPGLRRGTEGEL